MTTPDPEIMAVLGELLGSTFSARRRLAALVENGEYARAMDLLSMVQVADSGIGHILASMMPESQSTGILRAIEAEEDPIHPDEADLQARMWEALSRGCSLLPGMSGHMAEIAAVMTGRSIDTSE